MPINRAPWTALVDDDGSNLVGTVWNKDKIKTVILDPVDTALGTAWVVPPYTAGAFSGTGGMSWTVEAGDLTACAYCLINKTLHVTFAINGGTVGGTLSTTLQIGNAMWGGYSAVRPTHAAVAFCNHAGVATPAWILATGTVLQILKADQSAWAAATNSQYLYGQIFFEVA